ncbi:hypothetical protein I4U23_023633 [Adineta vaga]|nr:hypothetical protein I4U23_023633 [Adineta vaga]
MARRMKQMLAATARNMVDSDAFIPVLLLSELDVVSCSQIQFLEIIANIDELCNSKIAEERAKYIEQIYHRMLQLLSKKVIISSDHINHVVNQYVMYHPSMTILTLDDLKHMGIEMERRSVIIHFDMSGSMNVAGFAPLVHTITNLCTKIQSQGVQIHVSLFGGSVQENVHRDLNNRLLTLDEFIKGNYRPQGGTAFCPSFERTKDFPNAYDAIIISDGEFTDNISQLTFQNQCKTVFFIAPPWSPKNVEQKHAKSISSCVHTNVPYIGVASEQYSQLDTIIEGYLHENHSFAHLTGYTSVGHYVLPSNLLAPTVMTKIFVTCINQDESIASFFTKKLLGLFRYLEETAKLNFQRCLQSIEFQSLMSLITPLVKTSYGHLETSAACQQLYGYLSKILSTFTTEKQKLISQLINDEKAKIEINKFWDNAMSFSERDLIIADNEKKYGPPVGYLNLRVDSLTCTAEMLSEALQNLKVLYAPVDLDLLSLIFDLLCSCKINEKPLPGPESSNIPIWRKSDGTIELLSIIRLLPLCLQQFQYSRHIPLDNPWTLQPVAAIRLAWVMDVSGRTFSDFFTGALPSLVVPTKLLTDLNLDENRTAFWMKILRELAPKLNLPSETLQTIHQILSVHALTGFLLRLTDGSVSYEKPVYENVEPFIDTDEPKAWCVYIDEKNNRVNASTGKVIAPSTLITNPAEVAKFYARNLVMHGSLVRPRYLSVLENPSLPEGAIELYNTSTKKDVDILRDQLMELNHGSISADQINAHIYTIRDRYKSIPIVQWRQTNRLTDKINEVRAACEGAVLPNETVVINISRSVVIDYLVAHCNDPFIAGALRGSIEYSRVAKEQSSEGISKLDYVIECGQKSVTVPSYETMRFNHFDKPGVHEYLEKLQKKLVRALQSITNPPQFSSLSTLLKQLQSTTGNDEVLGLNDLEAIPEQAATTKSSVNTLKAVLDKEFFTCPITLDIMENPATTTPCGHMFDMDAITAYLKTVGGHACPICRTNVTNVSPNHAFKNVIEAWLAQQTE